MGMCCGSTVELSSLNLGSGSFRNVDEISIQGSVCRGIQLGNEVLLVMEVTLGDSEV